MFEKTTQKQCPVLNESTIILTQFPVSVVQVLLYTTPVYKCNPNSNINTIV